MKSEAEEARIKAIGNRIRQLRKEAGFTSHEAFADMNGFQRKQMWRLEDGENFTIQTLLRLTDKYGISLEDFFKGLK